MAYYVLGETLHHTCLLFCTGIRESVKSKIANTVQHFSVLMRLFECQNFCFSKAWTDYW